MDSQVFIIGGGLAGWRAAEAAVNGGWMGAGSTRMPVSVSDFV